ncbi:winged helix-turn-helix transcriptional regulator [Phaeobacter gallaeciensis]|uniref:Winged helix-turn-helix DNA-binding protein n=1 Tax=Phaeobacter gallaeciensis TaxID=60890 RepID=A0AAD0ECS1_9RHOB|nr:winged helix-turn-helix transcriptional regulator [Phaeobacter gallaeciensis]AHD09514.1 Winged helix-turn-helix DNA-binding protein [Phaeobacter gallaeciensis DSM 26640]ATE92779.1 Winged helix-turn-helix DNA-binding protein [Phaeobacter gallaeciensis]ATE97399.1 Winged helix-turn-helix DNA-binding protein [Phaeobacter gallaeciensis]ATF01444.1 Winged helix-turn-helix DNA-binding protein [Phaeobacter gallaeciensis]ATF05824.1 Winged helix-turn-helix DNA-binding protein [Phaeobacter gallaeciensi
MTPQQEHDRDSRDLKILRLLDEGLSQQQVADACGVTRGPIAKLVRDIRKDEAENA